MDRTSKARFDDAFEVGERIGAGGLGTVHACRARGKNNARGSPRGDPLVVKTVRMELDVGGCVCANVRGYNRVDAEIRALRRLDACAERDSNAQAAMFPSLVAEFSGWHVEKHPEDAKLSAARVVTTNPFGALSCDLARIREEARSRRGDTNAQFPESETRFYVAQIVVALRYMHVYARLAHGDVKPENVLVHRETGAVALCDFDLARATDDNERDERRSEARSDEDEASPMTDQEVVASRAADLARVGVLGTPEYIAPEVLRGTVDGATRHTDWYQLGVLAFELVFGKTPFASQFGVVGMTLRAIEANDLRFFDALFASAEEDSKNGDARRKASVSFLRFARALLEGDLNARLGDADVRDAEFFAPVEWEALERGGGLGCYGAFGTRAPTDWILSNEAHA